MLFAKRPDRIRGTICFFLGIFFVVYMKWGLFGMCLEAAIWRCRSRGPVRGQAARPRHRCRGRGGHPVRRVRTGVRARWPASEPDPRRALPTG